MPRTRPRSSCSSATRLSARRFTLRVSALACARSSSMRSRLSTTPTDSTPCTTTGLLDSHVTPSFDRLARVAHRARRARSSCLARGLRPAVFKSCLGLPEPWASQRRQPAPPLDDHEIQLLSDLAASAVTEACPGTAGRVLASCAWRRDLTTRYALEGFIPTAGERWIGSPGSARFRPGRELDALLGAPARGIRAASAFPHSRASGARPGTRARRAPCRLSLGTTRGDLARAVVDGIVHQVADAVEAMSQAVTLDVFR